MFFLRRLLSFALLFFAPWIVFAENEDRFSEAELDQMLAPIALYPDSLLAQILTASTYPLEIVAAARWIPEHENLKGDQAVEAAESENWDPSVTALVAFPDIISRMNDDLEWTQRLGEAVLIQEEQVMASVQKLREKAYTTGNLRSRDEIEVRREKEIIYIESVDPQIVYVPYYSPTIVYGSWWWHSHPPVYWKPFTHISIRTGSSHIVWSHGYRFSNHYFYSHPDWHRRHIVIHHHYHNHKKPRHVHRSRQAWEKYDSSNRWQHQPKHRRNVRYQNATARERFSQNRPSIDANRIARERPNLVNPANPRHETRRPENVRRESTVSAEHLQQQLNRKREERQNVNRYAERSRTRNNDSRRPTSAEETPQRPTSSRPFIGNENRRSSTVRSHHSSDNQRHPRSDHRTIRPRTSETSQATPIPRRSQRPRESAPNLEATRGTRSNSSNFGSTPRQERHPNRTPMTSNRRERQ